MTNKPDPYPFHRQEPARRLPPVRRRPEPSNWGVLVRLLVTAALIGVGVGFGMSLLRMLLNH